MSNQELISALSSADLTPEEELELLKYIPLNILTQHLTKTAVAWKVWCDDDIKSALDTSGYKVNNNNVELVRKALDVTFLMKEQEAEWDVFYSTIAKISDQLEY